MDPARSRPQFSVCRLVCMSRELPSLGLARNPKAALRPSVRHSLFEHTTLFSNRYSYDGHEQRQTLSLHVMNPWSGRGDRNSHMEAIDLTFSSPEPEVRRQHQINNHTHHQQPARPSSIREPPVLYQNMPSNDTHSQRRGSANVSQQHPRLIKPQHIKRMLDTSSHRALQEVVLKLCTTSPALSGAIARGLAPRSSWVLGLMQQAGSQTRTHHTIKTEPRASEQDARAHALQTQRPGSSKAPQSSTSHSRTHDHSTERRTQDGLRLPPIIKREHRPGSADSDDSNNILDLSANGRSGPPYRKPSQRHATAGSNSKDRSHANPELSHRNVTVGSSSRLHANPESSHRHGTATSKSKPGSLANPAVQGSSVRPGSTRLSAPDHKPKLCLQCHELFGEDDKNCFYHSGDKLPARPGDVPQYACCNKFEGEPGCKYSRHVSERIGTYTNTKRPSPSAHDDSKWLKRPRHL